VNPVSWEDAAQRLLEAKGSDVPCVVIDTPVRDHELVICQVASDNDEAGRLAARALVKAREGQNEDTQDSRQPTSRMARLHSG